jgi:O-antigen/teichoic acid export membrane protein
MMALIPMSLAYITGSLLTSDHRLKELNRMAFFGVILNVILNLALIPIYHAEGAAFSTAVTQVILLIIQFYYIKKFFKINFPLKTIVKYILFGIFVIIVAYVVKSYFPAESGIKFVLGIIISIIFALITGLYDLRSFKRILKNKLTTR